MAERRMFSRTIIDSDSFLDMALSTQALYFHLSMRADDEGFVNNHKKIARMIGSNEDELRVLVAKDFILTFESGVIVIKHWKLHNYIRADRLNSTNHTDEKATLSTEDNGSYRIDDTTSVTCQSSDSIGKVRLGKVRLDKTKEIIECEELKAYNNQNAVSLPKDTLWSKTTDEYKKAVEEHIESFIAEKRKVAEANGKYDWIPKIDAEDFILAMESKDYKYKNFIATYKTWLRR